MLVSSSVFIGDTCPLTQRNSLVPFPHPTLEAHGTSTAPLCLPPQGLQCWALALCSIPLLQD